MTTSSSYWADTPDPRHLPIRQREAWHWEAWDKEQDALGELIGKGGPEYVDTTAVSDDTGPIHIVHERRR
jgi:hypothetical protein